MYTVDKTGHFKRTTQKISRESLDWRVQLQMTTLTSWNERSGIQRDSLAQGDHIVAERMEMARHGGGRVGKKK